MIKLTVIIPFGGDLDYLDATLESVYNQTCKQYSICLVDDGTNLLAENFIANWRYKFEMRDIGLEIVRLKARMGVAHARNVAMSHVQTQYVAFLDADDIWPTNYLSSQLCFIERTGRDFIYCKSYFFSDNIIIRNSRVRNNVRWPEIVWTNGIGCQSGVVCNVIKIRELFVFHDESLKSLVDWDWYIRIAEKLSMECNSEAYFFYRVHASSITAIQSKGSLVSAFKMLDKYESLMSTSQQFAFLSLVLRSRIARKLCLFDFLLLLLISPFSGVAFLNMKLILYMFFSKSFPNLVSKLMKISIPDKVLIEARRVGIN